MRRWVFPGSFDPFTLGHLNISARAAKLCDELVIAVLPNQSKPGAFTPEERVWIVEQSIAELNNPQIKVIKYDGLLVDVMRHLDAQVVVRGLRSESDFRYEAEILAANRLLYPEFETVYFICQPEMSFTSSTIVREIASLGGSLDGMVSPAVQRFVAEVLQKKDTSRVKWK